MYPSKRPAGTALRSPTTSTGRSTSSARRSAGQTCRSGTRSALSARRGSCSPSRSNAAGQGDVAQKLAELIAEPGPPPADRRSRTSEIASQSLCRPRSRRDDQRPNASDRVGRRLRVPSDGPRHSAIAVFLARHDEPADRPLAALVVPVEQVDVTISPAANAWRDRHGTRSPGSRTEPCQKPVSPAGTYRSRVCGRSSRARHGPDGPGVSHRDAPRLKYREACADVAKRYHQVVALALAFDAAIPPDTLTVRPSPKRTVSGASVTRAARAPAAGRATTRAQ